MPAIVELMKQVDAYIPKPDRPVDKPFLLPIEDVFSISGRGTVVTGRVESGVINVEMKLKLQVLEKLLKLLVQV